MDAELGGELHRRTEFSAGASGQENETVVLEDGAYDLGSLYARVLYSGSVQRSMQRSLQSLGEEGYANGKRTSVKSSSH